MRATLTIDEDVAAKLRALAKTTGSSFAVLVNETLRRGLDAPERLAPSERFVIEARPLRQRPGIQLDNIAELLEQIEGREDSGSAAPSGAGHGEPPAGTDEAGESRGQARRERSGAARGR